VAVGHVFECARCGEDAGSVTVYAGGERSPADGDEVDGVIASSDRSRPRLEMRSGVGNVTIFEFRLDPTLAALGAGDARALHAIDVEIVPFWCAHCDASYCARHWTTWDIIDEGFFDERRGRCPKGHERMLLD